MILVGSAAQVTVGHSQQISPLCGHPAMWLISLFELAYMCVSACVCGSVRVSNPAAAAPQSHMLPPLYIPLSLGWLLFSKVEEYSQNILSFSLFFTLACYHHSLLCYFALMLRWIRSKWLQALSVTQMYTDTQMYANMITCLCVVLVWMEKRTSFSGYPDFQALICFFKIISSL